MTYLASIQSGIVSIFFEGVHHSEGSDGLPDIDEKAGLLHLEPEDSIEEEEAQKEKLIEVRKTHSSPNAPNTLPGFMSEFEDILKMLTSGPRLHPSTEGKS